MDGSCGISVRFGIMTDSSGENGNKSMRLKVPTRSIFEFLRLQIGTQRANFINEIRETILFYMRIRGHPMWSVVQAVANAGAGAGVQVGG
jgi:hypothetical protein